MSAERASWLDHVVQDPEIMSGKPVIRGTRIPVERVIAHLAHEPALGDLFAAYPELTIEDVKASLEYAHLALSKQARRKPQTHALDKSAPSS